MDIDYVRKCSNVNELERWKCYQDPCFNNTQTIKEGYPVCNNNVNGLHTFLGLSYIGAIIIIIYFGIYIKKHIKRSKDG